MDIYLSRCLCLCQWQCVYQHLIGSVLPTGCCNNSRRQISIFHNTNYNANYNIIVWITRFSYITVTTHDGLMGSLLRASEQVRARKSEGMRKAASEQVSERRSQWASEQHSEHENTHTHNIYIYIVYIYIYNIAKQLLHNLTSKLSHDITHQSRNNHNIAVSWHNMNSEASWTVKKCPVVRLKISE